MRRVNAASLHVNTAWIVVGLNAAAGCWALAAHWWEPARQRALWILTAVAHVSIMIQITIGVIALQTDGVEASDFHMFYGFLMIASVGILYSYRQQLMHLQYLLYGCGSLFIMGLGMRSLFLGSLT